MKETENPLDLISSCDDNRMSKSSGSRILIMTIVLILLALIIVGVIIAIMVTNKVKKTVDSMTEAKETHIIKDETVVEESAELEEKLDSAIFISDRKEYKSDLTEDELSKYDDKDITAQDVLDLASIAADKNTSVLVQTTALRNMTLYDGNTVINYGVLLPSVRANCRFPGVMTSYYQLTYIYLMGMNI